MPVTSSTPNSTPMISSGVAIHGVSPSDSGPPMAKPTKPAACWRSAGSCGEPDHMCHSPSAGSAIIAAPRISRGRASGWVRCASAPPRPRRAGCGTSTTAEPMTVRTTVSIQPPTGPRRVEPRTGGDAPPRRRAAPARCRHGGGRARGRGPARPNGRWIPRPWRPSASWRGPPGRSRTPRWRRAKHCVVARACAARGGGALSRAHGPLTCSNGPPSGRRSYLPWRQA